MKTALLVLTVGISLFGVNLFAADGDFIVNGNLGLGTTNPGSSRLYVNGTSTFTGTIYPSTNIQMPGSQFLARNLADTFYYDGVYIPHENFGWRVDSWNPYGYTTYVSGYAGITFFTSYSPQMYINQSGYVGIGTVSPGGYRLNVTAGSTYSQYGYYSGSDARWKKNIQPIGNALSLVQGLQGVRFNWNLEGLAKGPQDAQQMTGSVSDVSSNTNTSKTITDIDTTQIGFVAQDVEKILPEVVRTDSDGYKAISYEKLTAILIEAVKELKAEVDKLKKR